MGKEMNILSGANNKPFYLYQQPMFMLTVSVVLIDENGVIVIDGGDKISFPGGIVKASQETIQFSAVRQVKEQTGIVLRKDALIPVDFRSDPERSDDGNVVDIGMVSVLETSPIRTKNSKWLEVDFENRELVCEPDIPFYMDHGILLQRAIDVALMMRS